MTKPENLYIRRNRALPVLAAEVCVAVCALFIVLSIIFDRENLFDGLGDAIWFYVAVGFFGTGLLVIAVLNLMNLKQKFVIYTDEKGIYHYSGFVHLGFIPWEEIGEITCLSGAAAVFLNDSSARLRIFPKDAQAFWKKLSFLKRFGLGFGGNGIKVHTFGTRVKPQALGAALLQLRDYYTAQK